MGSFSIWHWMVIALIISIVVTIWAFSYSRSYRNPPYTGISGWLLLLAVGVYLAPIGTLGSLSRVTEGVDERIIQKFRLLFDGEIFLRVVLILLQLMTAFFMARKSKQFPTSFKITAVYVILLTPLDVIWSGAIISSQTDRSLGSAMDLVGTTDVLTQWIGASISVSVWLLYVARSRRVANTFVR